MKRTTIVLWYGMLVLGIALPLEGADGPSVELTFRYDQRTGQVRLANQRIVEAVAPKHRDLQPQPGELLVQCKNGSGQILQQLLVADPTMLHADWLAGSNPQEPGLLTGEPVRLPEADVVVVVPFNVQLSRVTFLKPQFRLDGTVDRFELAGSSAIDQAQLQGYLQRRGMPPE